MKKLSSRNSISKRKGNSNEIQKVRKKIRDTSEFFNEKILPEIDKGFAAIYFNGHESNVAPVPKGILDEAKELVYSVRPEVYGDPVECFERVSEACRIVWKISLKPDEIVKVLITMKQVRESYFHKRDNQTDVGGYTEILQLIKDKESKTKAI